MDYAADRPKLFYVGQGVKKVREAVLFDKYPTAFYEYDLNDHD